MNRSQESHFGTVYLVGAGPGDPGMVTLRAVECLRRADVVLYDYLVNPRILSHAAPNAELLCLGRHGVGRILSQDEINQQLIDLARAGKSVVRLKGGDPAVFARGAEEAAAVAAAEIPFEIVPGITAALAAGSCAGIPITHRALSSALSLITGQENPEKQGQPLDYAQLAAFPGTLVFYMGVTTAHRWIGALLDAGKPGDTPVAMIRRCSHPDQQTIRCRLDEVVDRLQSPQRLRPPIIFIVGRVAAAEHAMNWFESRPLFGQTILVTRPAGQAASLVNRFEELGAEVIVQPAIQIGEPPDWKPVDEAIEHLDTLDWLVFSSTNGVDYFLKRVLQTRDMRSLAGAKIAAVGPGTSEKLSEFHLKVDFQPDRYQAEALAAGLARDARNKRFLLVRASRGREVLPELIEASGGLVEQVITYHSADVAAADPEIVERLAKHNVDWITVTSSAIARSLVNLFGDSLQQTRIASISPITSATLRELGFEPAVEAVEFTMNGIIAAIVDASSH